MATFKPIAINRMGVQLPFKEGQFIVATQPFTDGAKTYQAGVYVDMGTVRQQLTTQGVPGEKGETGKTGATGKDGQAATVSVGQVQTGAPGSNALVTNSGTPLNAVLNFLLPRGENGPTGPQGASNFHSSAPSGTTVAIGSLQPQLTPLVGDAVSFPNGDVRQITGVNGSTVTLGDVLFSYKGDPGIGNATLSNIDGDSTENGFTQAAVKGVAQSKNYYNLGAFDTYVSNGDGTGTVTVKTQIAKRKDFVYNKFGTLGDAYFLSLATLNFKSNIPIPYRRGFDDQDTHYYDENGAARIIVVPEDIDKILIEYETPAANQYSYPVIDREPIRLATLQENLYWHGEWEKGLNLYQNNNNALGSEFLPYGIAKLKAGVYYISGFSGGFISVYNENQVVGGTYKVFESGYVGETEFTVPKDGLYKIGFAGTGITVDSLNTQNIMLNKGNHPYPYQLYNGPIIHENDLDEWTNGPNLLKPNLYAEGTAFLSLGNAYLETGKSYILKATASNAVDYSSIRLRIVMGANVVQTTPNQNIQSGISFTYSGATAFCRLQLDVGSNANPNAISNPMLNKGTSAVNYVPYGSLARAGRVPLYLTDNETSPAQLFGGSWTELGSFTVGSATIHAWKEV